MDSKTVVRLRQKTGGDNVFDDVEVREQLNVLEGASEADGADSMRNPAGDISAVVRYVSFTGWRNTGDTIEEGSLARAVRPDEGRG